ncbi:het domain-containing protein [Xylariaceae sp. FL1651]|nr:het domain-containing protein [Xylariaceae sp. FL1651]
MRLINASEHTTPIEEFFNDIPKYAILSHRWGKQEVTLQDWSNLDTARKKSGYAKIEGSCKQALNDGIQYVWVDTNCIDKSSSAELSEAINSMFTWYHDSEVCYVYLEDVSIPAAEEGDDPILSDAFREDFSQSLWFTRGWTLQELVAPKNLVFYSKDWRKLGTKRELRRIIADVTGIDSDYLLDPEKIYTASVARRMSWMSGRATTRIEDMAYCMLGIFDINMALLYGEGRKAFLRLQEEIIKVSNDQTIFCWNLGYHDETQVPPDWVSILAPHPAVFEASGRFFPGSTSNATPYSITNYGLALTLPVLHTALGVCAVLDVGVRTGGGKRPRVVIRLYKDPNVTNGHYARLLTSLLVTEITPRLMRNTVPLFVDCRNNKSRGIRKLLLERISSPELDLTSGDGATLLLWFNTAVSIASTPMATVGMDFHHLDSAVHVGNNMPTKTFGALLRIEAGFGSNYLLLVGGKSDKSGQILWYIEFTVLSNSNGSAAPADHANPKLVEILRKIEERQLFGTWCHSESLKSVALWSNPGRGATVCFLELNKTEASQTEFPSNDLRFYSLRKSTHDKTLDGWTFEDTSESI